MHAANGFELTVMKTKRSVTLQDQHWDAGMYRGLGVTMIRDTPSYGIYFCLYENGKEALEPGSRQHGCRNPLTVFVSGARPGWLGQLCL